MIIWSGWGILVVMFAAIGFFLGVGIGAAIPAEENIQMAAGFLIAGLLSGGATMVFARSRENKPGRTFIDEQTGQRIEVRPSAGSLFFIPTRYWAFILPGIGLLGAWAGYGGV